MGSALTEPAGSRAADRVLAELFWRPSPPKARLASVLPLPFATPRPCR